MCLGMLVDCEGALHRSWVCNPRIVHAFAMKPQLSVIIKVLFMLPMVLASKISGVALACRILT